MSANVHQVQAGFSVLETADEMQTAVMTLAPGEASGPKHNEHARSEQMLYVVEGSVEAEIGDRRFTMDAGDSVIVGKGVAHRFSNPTPARALTLNVYAPPAY